MQAPEPAPTQLASWEEAVQLFGARSTDLQVAAAELLRAEGQRRQALGALLPQLSGTGLLSFSLLPAPPGDQGQAALFGAANYQTASLALGLAVIDPRAWNQMASALTGVRESRLTLDESRRLLLLNLAQALLTAVTGERLAEVNRVGLRDALARLQLSEKASRAGAGTDIDLGRTRQDVELARLQVVAADESLRQAREALGLAIGADGPVSVRPDFQLNALADRVQGSCRAITNLEARTDVRAAKTREELAAHGVWAVKTEFLPSLALRSNAQVFAFGGNVFPIWNLQAVLTVPLWDGGARYGALNVAHARQAQAQARTAATVRQARIDIERARRNIDVAQQSVALARKALGEAERIDVLTRKAYDQGIGTSLELVTAASALRQQQLAVALREYDVLRAQVTALFALAECSQ